MENLLALTLADETPEQSEGEGPSFRWRWLGRGVLELTPTASSALSLLLSTGIHGNETAPVEIVDGLLRALYRGEIALACRVLVVLGNPPALAQNKRYLVSDINRMFGGRWSQFPQSDETARAQWLENVVTTFCRGGTGALASGSAYGDPRLLPRALRRSAAAQSAVG